MKRIAVFSIFCLLITVGFAQDRLTPELLWKIGRISDEQVSPDGQYVLFGMSKYELSENKGNRNLYIINLGAGSKGKAALKSGVTRQLTDMEGSEFSARWRPDGKAIGFLSASSGSVQLWEINPDGSNLHQVSDIDGGIANFAYSPKGDMVSFTMDVKMDKTVNELYPDLPEANARLIDDLMYRHWNAWHDYAYSHVFVASYFAGKIGEKRDIMENEPYDSPLNPFGGDEQIAWHPDGKLLAYTSKKKKGKEYTVSTNSEIYLYDHTTKETKNLTKGMMGYDVEPAFSPDGSKIAWLSMERDGFESDRNRIFVQDLSTGKKEELTTGFDQSAGHLHWAKDSKSIYFTSVTKATYQMYKVDVASKNIQQLTFGTHNYYSVHEAGDMLIGRRTSMSYPAELYKVDPRTSKQTPLTVMNQQTLKDVQWGEVKERTVKTTDGKDMLTWVIYPPDFDPDRKYPTLLYCQGGPQSAVSQFFSYRWNFQLMAAQGYIVVAPNRRGLPGFGQQWNDDISGDWGGQAMRDYLAAIDDVAKENYVDNDKLGAVGASYGGYSVYYLAGIHEKRFKTFISHCGLFNLESWYGATEEMFFANWDLKGAYFNSPPPPSYEKFSPHKLVDNWDTPILVIHGEKDFRVPVTEGMQAFNVAQLKGIPSKFLYFPEEGHWVQQPQNGVLWHRVFFNWLGTYLKE